MWTKITTIEQLRNLSEGAIIYKYPLQGPAKEEFNEADRQSISLRPVKFNNRVMGSLRISLIPNFVEFSRRTSLPQEIVCVGEIHKKYDEIIEEGVYWIFSPNIVTSNGDNFHLHTDNRTSAT